MKMAYSTSVIFIFLACLTVSESNTSFQRIGWISPNPSYGHVHLTVDLNMIESHLNNMLLTLTTLSHEIIEFNRPEIKLRCHHFLLNTITKLKNLRQKFAQYKRMVNLPTEETKRTKRFLGIILAMTSLATSLYNTAEILHIKSSLSDIVKRQHHITGILQSHEVSIHNIEHNVDQIKEDFKRTVMVIEDIDAMSAFLDTEIIISKAMSELHRMVDCIISGTEHLLLHRLPLCFTNTSNLEKAHKSLTRDAHKRMLSPIPIHIASYLQLETSFILEQDMLHIFVHVPLSDHSQNLELLRFYSVPIAISPSLHMQLDTQEKYLALNKEGFHTTLTDFALSKCKKYADILLCDEPLILKKKIDSTCLGSIYSQNFTNLQQKCPVVFFEATEMIDTISANEFMIYTQEPQTLRIACPKSTEHVAIISRQLVKLNHGCKATTREHVFGTGFDVTVNADVLRWPTIWNISELLFGVESKVLHDVLRNLDLLDSKPTRIRDIKKMIWLNDHSKVNKIVSTIVAVISILLIGSVSYLIFRWYKVSKVQSAEK